MNTTFDTTFDFTLWNKAFISTEAKPFFECRKSLRAFVLSHAAAADDKDTHWETVFIWFRYKGEKRLQIVSQLKVLFNFKNNFYFCYALINTYQRNRFRRKFGFYSRSLKFPQRTFVLVRAPPFKFLFKKDNFHVLLIKTRSLNSINKYIYLNTKVLLLKLNTDYF